MPASLAQLGIWILDGWQVFPVFKIENGRCACGKADCDSPGKHPMTWNGVRDASDDPRQILRWYNYMPGCNWGVATGARSKLWVLDLDVHAADGVAAFRAWREANGIEVPVTYVVQTGGGGWHLYFAGGAAMRNRAGVLPGVDVRGDGGYVVLPGSSHISGGVYSEFNGAELAPAPAAILNLAREAGVTVAPIGGSGGSDLPPTTELLESGFRLGERDLGFQALAWRLVRQHWPHMDLVYERAREVWEQTDRPANDPYPWSEVEAKLARAAAAIAPDIEAQLNWASNLRSHTNV